MTSSSHRRASASASSALPATASPSAGSAETDRPAKPDAQLALIRPRRHQQDAGALLNRPFTDSGARPSHQRHVRDDPRARVAATRATVPTRGRRRSRSRKRLILAQRVGGVALGEVDADKQRGAQSLETARPHGGQRGLRRLAKRPGRLGRRTGNRARAGAAAATPRARHGPVVVPVRQQLDGLLEREQVVVFGVPREHAPGRRRHLPRVDRDPVGERELRGGCAGRARGRPGPARHSVVRRQPLACSCEDSSQSVPAARSRRTGRPWSASSAIRRCAECVSVIRAPPQRSSKPWRRPRAAGCAVRHGVTLSEPGEGRQ